jgi:hypothetical protein
MRGRRRHADCPGHGHILATRKLGLTEVQAIVLAGLTKTQCRALPLAAFNAG